MSGNYFAVLGVPALLGRPLTVDDDRTAGGSPVAVISYPYWQRRFAGDPGVLGRTVTLNRVPFTVVGVMPPGFSGEVVGRMTDCGCRSRWRRRCASATGSPGRT